MIYVAAGMGTNTAAVLIGLRDRGIRPDAIAFADTGGERPHTYAYIETLNNWLKKQGFPLIDVLSPVSETLEENCLRRKALPSVAYGFKTCSQRFKGDPQRKYLNHHPLAIKAWEDGGKVTKVIGFDFDEPQRAKPFSDEKTENWYPLIDWEWGRDECIKAIKKEGLPLPGKSACFFCPNSRHSEIRELARQYPELAERAIAMERNAELTAVKGLGRNWAWEHLLQQNEMFDFPDRFDSMPCECYDG